MLGGCASRGSVSQLKENLAQTQREADRNAAAAAMAQQAAFAAQSGQATNAAAAAASEAALANQKAEQALREANEARSAAAAAMVPAPEPSVDTVTVIEDTVKKPVVKTIGHKNVKRKRIIHHHHTY
jgi:hypothetical protein